MKIVGFTPHRSTTVLVGRLSENGGQVSTLIDLREFWSDPRAALGLPDDGQSTAVSSGRLVPSVLPQARVICIGLNYLKHGNRLPRLAPHERPVRG